MGKFTAGTPPEPTWRVKTVLPIGISRLGREHLMKMLYFTLFILSLAGQLRAAEEKPAMTRIEYRRMSPNIAPDSFPAKPVVLYRAGKTYLRSEEQADEKGGIHELIICAEPDIWMINLIPRTGTHIVDPGPSYDVHHNILPRDAPEFFASFEYGMETDFFRDQHAKQLETRAIDGQKCDVSELSDSGYRLVLFANPDTHLPLHLDIFKEGKPHFSIRYLSYKQAIPFDADLFKPPADVKLTEAKSNPGN